MYIHKSKECIAYVDVHFKDHVGRSFSRIRVYTDRVDCVPTASKPGGGEGEERQQTGVHTRHAV